MTKYIIILFFLVVSGFFSSAQTGTEIKKALDLGSFLSDSGLIFQKEMALFSFILNGKEINSKDGSIWFNDSSKTFFYGQRIEIKPVQDTINPLRTNILFKNTSADTLVLENIVPLDHTKANCHITGEGPWALARTKLYRPGKDPVGVILPDNAWEMGYCSVPVNGDQSLAAIARRNENQNARKGRYKTHLYPGGSVSYTLFFENYQGTWQDGLRLLFHDRYLYDLVSFEDSLYRRGDLQWIRDQYLIVLQFAWDHDFYDHTHGGYKFQEFLDKYKKWCGGIDVFGIWPTWPTLGLDQRNQWDLYSDLPGGLPKLAELSNQAKELGTRFFIAYNPWDQSTRKENPYRAMAGLIAAVDADGVVLDTRGSSSQQLQQAADSVKPGVVMYSEGMAVPEDMPGILAGRVHDAIFMPPILNLNKLIRPDFNIYRVCQLSQGRIHREVCLSLFNGYGVELNTFAPGRPDWIPEEISLLGHALRILRENSSTFKSNDWTPLIDTKQDGIWVNEFKEKEKIIYTIYSLLPAGFQGGLFQRTPASGHFVSLWKHEERETVRINGKTYIPVHTDPFDKSFLETRREGQVDCIAWFPEHLILSSTVDSLYVTARKGDEIRIWNGNPAYDKSYSSYQKKQIAVRLTDELGVIEEKMVVQLMDKGALIDERVVMKTSGSPRKISTLTRTEAASGEPSEMVFIPGGYFSFAPEAPSAFIPYPSYDSSAQWVPGFYIDKYPVTNNQFYDFIESTGYRPEYVENFLKHWEDGKYPRGSKNKPVVYISYEDAQAYAQWAGKRLPTEQEWQYAAQGTDQRLYPWGSTFDSTLCNTGMKETTSVNEYPGGASPFGVMDLVGNVWQLTNDVYDNGSYYYIIIRGGSYYNPTSSWWYVKGGPQPLNRTQMLLRVSPGFERNGTVGFRCVMDGK